METYLSFVRSVFNEWLYDEECQDAFYINKHIGKIYVDTCNPHFFTGNLSAELVMVNLNPKRDSGYFFKKAKYSWEEYLDYYSYFGRHHYGEYASGKHKSKFDQKLIRFMKPLGILDIASANKNRNLENVVDQKLQLELIPVGSPDFNYRLLPTEILKKYLDQILKLITSEKRKCVIFGGRVFCSLLTPYISSETTHSFRLKKVDGQWTKNEYELIELTLSYESNTFRAYIAPQFAQHGMPVEPYGEELAKLIRKPS